MRREQPAKNTASGYGWNTKAPEVLAHHMNSTRHRLMGKTDLAAEAEATRILAEWQDAQPAETKAELLYVREGDLCVMCRGRSRGCDKLDVPMAGDRNWTAAVSRHIKGAAHQA